MRRVSALDAPRFDIAVLLETVEKPIQETLLGAATQETHSELGQHAVIEARIGKPEPQHTLPVNAASNRVGSLPTGEVLHELEDGNQRQAPRGEGGLSAMRIEIGEVCIGVDRAERVAEREVAIALREGRFGGADGLFRDGQVFWARK